MLISVIPQNLHGQFADGLMVPVMYLLQGTIWERPQRTHFWNNTKLSPDELALLDESKMVTCDGDATARSPRFLGTPLFHAPVFGGWRQFAVIRPVNPNALWYPGWCAPGHAAGYSNILMQGPVRMLIGPMKTNFFGLSDIGSQETVQRLAVGKIGDAHGYGNVPLR